MIRIRNRSYGCASILAILLALAWNLAMVPFAHAQAGLSTGTIQGTILDPGGASVTQANVSIRSKATGATIAPEVTKAGTYNSGPLVPGEYVIRVEASGFKVVEQTVTVRSEERRVGKECRSRWSPYH